MRIHCLLILSVFVQITFAQNFNFGITAGGNISTVFMQSDYLINDENFNELQYIPLPGFELGLFTSHQLSRRVLLMNTIDFAHLSYKKKGAFESKTVTGETWYTSDKFNKCNNNLRVYLTINYLFFGKLMVGTGAQVNVLLWSRTNFDSDFPVDFEYTFNQYYKRITFSVPLRVGFRFSSFEISTEARIGIDDRKKGTESLIKEREGSVSLKFNYYFLSSEK